MVYTLWDTETHNMVAEHEQLEDALQLVLRGIERNGPHDADTLALEREDERGESATIARGQELAELARHEIGRDTPLAR